MAEPMNWALLLVATALVILRLVLEHRARQRAYDGGFSRGYDRAVQHWVKMGAEQDPARAYAAGFAEAQRRAIDIVRSDYEHGRDWVAVEESIETVAEMLPHNRFVDEDGEDWTPFGEEVRRG